MKHIYFISHCVQRGKGLFIAFTIAFLYLLPASGFAQAQLFGLTSGGGQDGIGTLFRYDPATQQHHLKQSMRNLAPGIFAGYVELTDGGNGKFYGMTINGGAFDEGVIFEWDPITNIYTRKVDFASANGGGYSPMGSLTLYNGKFYGMTPYGGANGIGTIFEWDPISNIMTKRRDMDMVNGGFPFGALSMYNGKFYGMTSIGGGGFSGTLFEWDPVTNIYITQLDFVPATGQRPYGSLVLQGTKFYGTTTAGGATNDGVIFEWNPATGVYVKKIDLAYATGNGSFGSLTYSMGKFYGTTDSGGVNNKGVIFEWDPVSNVYTKKIDLSPATGGNGHGNMALGGAKFYGLTARGGLNNRGVIFEWNPANNTYVKKVDLGPTTGGSPFGAMVLRNGKFYGINCTGGTPDKGTIFEWDPLSNVYLKKIELNYSIGSGPTGTMVLNGGKMYGMTLNGGNFDKGVIFEYDTATYVYTKKIDMTVASGCNPYGSLSFYSNKYYGMTSKGGTNNLGVIFEWDPVTNVYTKKIDLSSANGCEPWGNLTLIGNKFYGMMQNGGATNEGVIFEWDPASNVYTKKIDLVAATGRNPFGSLTLNNAKLYGMTAFGGVYNRGVIFEWDPAANVYSKKIDLVDSLGMNPFGSLSVSNNIFYGMTFQGGTNLAGVIFDWNPATNVYRDRVDLNPSAAKKPYGSLVQVGSKFYGMTSAGGLNNGGCIFDWDTLTNVFTSQVSLNNSIGSLPFGDLLIRPCNLPPQPASISGPTNICELSTNTYSIPPVPGAMTYTWTLPNGWSGTSLTNSISALSAFTGGNITVRANDNCGISPAQTLTVVVNQMPQTPGPINGSQTVCSNVLTTYSVTPVAGANNYIWTLPGGWTGSSVTNTINVTPSAVSGSVTVRANNTACGASPAQSLYVTVYSIPATPSSLAGPSQVCAGTTHTFTATQMAGATSYTWTLPPGWTGSSTTNTISATAGANSGNVTVTANSSCGSSPARTLAVTVNPIYTTTNTITLCQGDSIYLGGAFRKTPGTYSSLLMTIHGCDSTVVTTLNFNALPVVTLFLAFKAICIDGSPIALSGGMPLGGTYSGVGISNGMLYPAVAGLGIHSVTYTYTDINTGCTNTATKYLAVNPLPPIPFINSSGDTFTSSAVYGNQWYLNGNAIAAATGKTHIATANGNYTVCFTDSSGCKSCSSVLNYTLFSIQMNESTGQEIQVFPNPVQDVLTVVTDHPEKALLILYNTLGEQVYSGSITDKKTLVDMKELPAGMYILQVRSLSGISNARIIKE